MIRIFTDGSCVGNGNKNAKAGVGVHFPDKQLPDVGFPYTGQRLSVCPRTCTLLSQQPDATQSGGRGGHGKSMITNQRAELGKRGIAPFGTP